MSITSRALRSIVLPAAILIGAASSGHAARSPLNPENAQQFTTFCDPQGMGDEAGQLTSKEKKNLAALCAAYFLAGFEVTGGADFLDAVMTYAKKYELTVQDIDPVTYPDPEKNTFVADMKKIGLELKSLPHEERQSRADKWQAIASTFFQQTVDRGESVLPANFLILAREWKQTLPKPAP
jgi:hypothetical protein